MHGYFTGLNFNVTEENIYNRIDGLGFMIYSPVETVLKEFKANKNEISFSMYGYLHLVSHVFESDENILIKKEILT